MKFTQKSKDKSQGFKAFDSLIESFLYGLEEVDWLVRSDSVQNGVVTAWF